MQKAPYNTKEKSPHSQNKYPAQNVNSVQRVRHLALRKRKKDAEGLSPRNTQQGGHRREEARVFNVLPVTAGYREGSIVNGDVSLPMF